MSDIEQKARELLAAELGDYEAKCLMEGLGGAVTIGEALGAISAALTPPDGYLLVPVKITKEIEGVLNESFEYGYSAESTWDLAIHASSAEVK